MFDWRRLACGPLVQVDRLWRQQIPVRTRDVAYERFRAPAAAFQPTETVHLIVVSVEMCRGLAIAGRTVYIADGYGGLVICYLLHSR